MNKSKADSRSGCGSCASTMTGGLRRALPSADSWARKAYRLSAALDKSLEADAVAADRFARPSDAGALSSLGDEAALAWLHAGNLTQAFWMAHRARAVSARWLALAERSVIDPVAARRLRERWRRWQAARMRAAVAAENRHGESSRGRSGVQARVRYRAVRAEVKRAYECFVDALPVQAGLDLSTVAAALPVSGALVTVVAAAKGGAALALRAGSASIVAKRLPGMKRDSILSAIGRGKGGVPDGWSSGYRRFHRAIGRRLCADAASFRAWDRVILKTLHRLSRMGWGGMHRWLREVVGIAPGSEIVLAVPAWLAVLPLAAVPDPATGRCLLDDYAVRLIPNADLLVRSAAIERSIDPADYALLSVIDPTGEFPGEVRRWQRSQEHLACRRHTILQGGAATVSRTLVELPAFTHYLNYGHGSRQRRRGILQLSPDPGAPASGGTLTEARIRTLKLARSRLTVLATCESALIDLERQPEEHRGLATGFLLAGSAGVIASLWPVESEATRRLAERVLERHLGAAWRGSETSPAQALRLAQLELRDGAQQARKGRRDSRLLHALPRAATPRRGERADVRQAFHWAAFCCMGA